MAKFDPIVEFREDHRQVRDSLLAQNNIVNFSAPFLLPNEFGATV